MSSAKLSSPVINEINKEGVKRLVKQMLATAYMDGTVYARRFANSPLCENICIALGYDYRKYRKRLIEYTKSLQKPKMLKSEAIL